MTSFNFEFERGGRLQQKGRIMKTLWNSKKQIVAEFCPEVCPPSNLKYFLERLFSNSNTSISFLTLFDTKLEMKRLMVLLSFISNSQLATDSSHHEGTLHFLVGQNCPFCWRSEPACELFAELSHFWWFRQMPGVRFVEGFQEAKRARWEYFSLSSWAFTFLL